ncbi:MAG: MgtC/SapB family protein [Planctomycetes bacterium]|nr:MgtC/SapB family protein [Planctomycetota bacterium]
MSMIWNEIAVDLRPDILLRIGLTLAAGFILGIERERHGRAAGLRTTLLVSLSACAVMIISDSFYLNDVARTGVTQAAHPDPARLAAGALSGMGFLGAGVIIRQTSHIVRGVTTAATLWSATVIGLAFGSGAIGIGLLTSGASFIILYLLPVVESRIQDDWYADFSVNLNEGGASIDRILSELKTFSIKIKSIDIQTSQEQPRQRITFHLKFKKMDLVRFPVEVTQRIGQLEGVRDTHWHA